MMRRVNSAIFLRSSSRSRIDVISWLISTSVGKKLESPARTKSGFIEYSNIGKIAIAFGIVEPVADYERVGNAEADIVQLAGVCLALGFFQQRRDADGTRPAFLEQCGDIR